MQASGAIFDRVMDHGAVANGHPERRLFFDDPSLHDLFGGGELGAVIDANQRAGVGGEADGAALFGGEWRRYR